MPRPATGSVVAPTERSPSWAIRFRAGGKRRLETLGRPEDGWNRERAGEHLRHVLADVERGIWQPKTAASVPATVDAPNFHEFATDWLDGRRHELRPRTVQDYEWALSYHLLPFFRDHELSAITVAEVDRYKASKLAEGRIGAAQINKTLKLLAMVMDVALEYGIVDTANPARGRRRRVKAATPLRTWVEPEQLLALLESTPKGHRPMVGVLAGAGLRIGEACALDWRDLDLAAGTLVVQASKTPAGRREVELPRGLIDELWTLAATSAQTDPGDPVFVGTHRTRQTPANVARRLKTAITRANPKLEEVGIAPISDRVTPHSLRRTFASLRYACGDDPVYVAEQGGWTDPTFVIKVYARSVRRRQRLSGAHADAFDRAIEWAGLGSKPENPVEDDVASVEQEPRNRLPRAEI